MTSRLFSKSSVLLLAIAAIAFVSCKKDKSGPGNPGNQTKKISRIEENGSTTASFEYNTDGTLKKVSTKFDGPQTAVFSFTYDNQKRPIEVASDQGFKSKYVYVNNVLKLTENFEGATKVSENNFAYENGKLKSNTVFTAVPQPGGNTEYHPTYRAVYHYYPTGAVQKVSTYILNPLSGELELMFEYVYQQYDDKKNPLAVMSDFSQVIMFHPIHVNNPLIEKLYGANGIVDETTQNVYTYDAAGYPLTCKSTVTPTGGTPLVKDIKYIY
ncbi:MAG TPA: hypothetical protein VGD17_02515 [Chitinophagaceae bacterium]